MSFKDKLTLSIKRTLRNKSNLIMIILFSLCSVVTVFGISYYMSISDFWSDWTEKDYMFNTYLVLYDYDKINDNELFDKISKENVSDVFYYYQNSIVGYALNFKNKNIDGETIIMGTVPNTKKIKYGENVKKDYEIICPSKYLPISDIYNKYNYKLEIDMKDRINSDLEMNVLSSVKSLPNIKFKIVGLYDEKYDYSTTNICYTNHSTIEKINRTYQPELFENKYNIFFLANEFTNIENIKNIDGVEDVLPIQTIKTSIGTDILKNTSILLLSSYIITIIISMLLYKKNFERKMKEYGTLLSIGYERKDIKNINNIEIMIILLISIILSTIILYISSYIFPIVFLKNDMQLCRITINIRIILIVFNVILSYIFLLFINKNIIKLLNKSEIKKIVEM